MRHCYSRAVKPSLTSPGGMFIAARGILGFGLAFNITAAPLLILELAFPTQRVSPPNLYHYLD